MASKKRPPMPMPAPPLAVPGAVGADAAPIPQGAATGLGAPPAPSTVQVAPEGIAGGAPHPHRLIQDAQAHGAAQGNSVDRAHLEHNSKGGSPAAKRARMALFMRNHPKG